MVKVRVNPKHLNEFRNLIKDISVEKYKEKIEKNVEEQKITEEFKDWKYEYKNSTKEYYNYIIFDFKVEESNCIVKKILGEIFNKKINKQSLWYKKEVNKDILNPDVNDEDKKNNLPKYTIYVITKGRWDTNYTVKSLEKLEIQNYKVVIEEQEVEKYIQSGIDETKIIKFNKEDKTNLSGIPVRNFVWNYSINKGEKYHWILDDNIKGFYRWNRNKRFEVDSGYPFKHIEEYTETKNNVVLSGMNYFCFNNDIDYKRTLIQKNTRIYSCILIKNHIEKLEEKWRGLFNEDTDLSIRVLKLGYSTLLFNNYLCGKQQTGKLKGGNEELYKNYTQEGYKIKTLSLIEQHPDIVKSTKKFQKECHHLVNYKNFKNNKLTIEKEVKKEIVKKLRPKKFLK